MSNIKFARPHRPSVEELAQGVLAGNRALLGRAITLIESNAVRDQESSRALISRLLPHSGNAVRIGITGVPGAGKSSFIEAFGTYLCKKGFKVAVLAIDPSSSVSRGSIMGDKTRMEELSGEENAFIRPSPSGGSLGGVARKTRETMIACEAAGFDIILIETVGVGQSETTVRSMVDIFMLLLITGAGDDLQGIKRGIMELADILVVTKDDGDNRQRAAAHCQELKMVLHYLQSPTPGWTPSVLTCSSLEGRGLDTIEETLFRFRDSMKESGFWYSRRRSQSLSWVQSLVHEALLTAFEQHPAGLCSLPCKVGGKLRVQLFQLLCALQSAGVAALLHDGAVFPQRRAIHVRVVAQQVHPVLALKVVAGQLHGGDQLYPVLPGVGIGVLGAEQGVVVRKGDGVQPGAGGDGCQPLDGHSTVGAGGMDMQVTGHSGLLP